MKKIMAIFATMFITAIILSSCSNHGKEKNFNGVQLFYTSTITETEADLLGNYLIKSDKSFDYIIFFVYFTI